MSLIFILIWAVQPIYGLQQLAGNLEANLVPGQNQTLEWMLFSDSSSPETVEIMVEGEGSEFLTFQKSINLEPNKLHKIPIVVTIPQNHKRDITLKPAVIAVEKLSQNGATIINIQMKKILTINVLKNDKDGKIPPWVKNNAKWWSHGEIDDSDFVKGIQFLIKEKIMTIPPVQDSETKTNNIPTWIKNNAKWWADGQIDDTSFIQGIEYLAKHGIVSVK